MAVIQSGLDSTVMLVRPYRNAARVSVVPASQSYSVSAVTGTIAAALAANSTVFAARLDPGASLKTYITRVTLIWTTLVTFTVPITVGRRLALFRGSGAAPTAGTSITTAFKKDNSDTTSEMQVSGGGDLRISTTTGLTISGITYESPEFATMSLIEVGTAGNTKTQTFEFDSAAGGPIVLQPGELIAVRNPQAMDAAGTWQLAVNMDWYEL